jgi:hypothetical protein
MIDRASRDTLAENIRHLVAGITTNFEYEEAIFSVNTDDAAVKDLVNTIWCLYDDLKEHKLEVEKFTPEDYKTFARFILFLKTDQEYKWPNTHIREPLIRLLANVFTLGIYTRKKDNEFLAAGDVKYWPFLNKEEFELAKKTPVYLNKQRTTSDF